MGAGCREGPGAPSPSKEAESGRPQIEPEFKELALGDIRTIATLGVGGFGRVELVILLFHPS